MNTHRLALPLVGLAILIHIPVHAAEQIRTVLLLAADMVYSKTRQQLYLCVPSSAENRPNSVTIVHPYSATVGKSLYLESEPILLAMSGNERYLYVGLVGGDVVRIDLNGFTRDLTFSTIGTGVEATRWIIDLKVFPDQPRSVVVVVDQGEVSGWEQVLAVFDDGIMRPRKTPPGTFGINRFTFGEDASTGWGYHGISDGFRLYRMKLDSEGISVADEGVVGLIVGWWQDLRFWERAHLFQIGPRGRPGKADHRGAVQQPRGRIRFEL